MPKRGKDGRPGGQLDIEGVLDEWDSTQAIRDRLRQGGRLVDTTDCTVKTCGQYSEVLGPIILRMAGGPNKVPDVSPLREEIPNLYVKNKQDKSVEHEDVIEESMIIRKMCGFVKMKVRREEVSVVSLFLDYQENDDLCEILFIGILLDLRILISRPFAQL